MNLVHLTKDFYLQHSHKISVFMKINFILKIMLSWAKQALTDCAINNKD